MYSPTSISFAACFTRGGKGADSHHAALTLRLAPRDDDEDDDEEE